MAAITKQRDIIDRLKIAEALAVSLGYAKVRLYTNKMFVANVQLYRRLGYLVDCEETFAGGVAVHMSKQL